MKNIFIKTTCTLYRFDSMCIRHMLMEQYSSGMWSYCKALLVLSAGNMQQ